MQAKHLVLISGLALTLASGPVLAQTRTGNEQDSRQRMQDRQDRLEDASRGARDRDSRFGSSTNILTSLEGIWNVKVQVNRTNWDLMNGGGQTDSRMPGQDGVGVDNNNPQRRDRDGVDATNPQTNPQQPQRDREGMDRQNDRQTDRQNDRQNDRQTDGRVPQQTGTQMASADGLARSHAILGGDILRTTLIFGVDAASTTTNPGVQDRQMQERQQREQDANPARRNQEREQERTGNPDGVQPRDGTTTTTTTTPTAGGMMDNNALRSVSFLGYNESTGEYNLALMTANGGGIHYFTGKYDQSDRRIIFTTAEGGVSAATTGSRTTTTDGATTAMGSGSLSVVLQMEGNDRYTVTAYRGTATTTGAGSRTELGGQPAQRQNRDTNNPGQGNQGEQAMTGQDAMAPNVIYKATYTKADSTMRSQHDRIFDEREQNERRAQLRVR